jgi:hypothetical protein
MKHPRLSLAKSSPLLLLAALTPLAGSCGDDPTHDAQVAALGDELPDVPVGPYHRAGQPCTVCHGGLGPANTVFSMAGTVFSSKSSHVGADKVQIRMVDANRSSPTEVIVTNCVGNFFVTPDVWSPAFPVGVGITSGTMTDQMFTQISRAGSCAECHTDPPSVDGVGHVYIDVSVNPNEERKCPVSVSAGGGFEGGVP